MNLSHPGDRRTKIPLFVRERRVAKFAPPLGDRKTRCQKKGQPRKMTVRARGALTNTGVLRGRSVLPGGLEAAGAGGEDVASESRIDEVRDATLGPQLSVILVARVGGAAGEQLGQVRVGGDRTGGGGGGSRQRQQQQ